MLIGKENKMPLVSVYKNTLHLIDFVFFATLKCFPLFPPPPNFCTESILCYSWDYIAVLWQRYTHFKSA